jgi:hypothetical protein
LRRLKEVQVPQNPYRGAAHYLAATLHFLLGEDAEAAQEFAQAEALGRLGRALVYADLLASQRRYAEAEAALQAGARVGVPAADVPRLLRPIALDRGDAEAARQAWERAADAARQAGAPRLALHALIGLQLDVLLGDAGAARDALDRYLRHQAALLDASTGAEREQILFGLQVAGLLAAHRGHADLLQLASEAIEVDRPRLRRPVLERQALLLAAERLRLAGRAGEAAVLLRDRLDEDSGYLHRILLLQALIEAGAKRDALELAEALMAQRGRAFADWNLYIALQPWHVLESNVLLLQAAELAEAQGQPQRAQALRDELRSAWTWVPERTTLSELRLTLGAPRLPVATAAGPSTW